MTREKEKISEKYANKMHIEQDVVDFEMGDTVHNQDNTDEESRPDNIVGNGDDTDIAVDIAKGLTHDSRTNETEPELQNKVDNGIANDGDKLMVVQLLSVVRNLSSDLVHEVLTSALITQLISSKRV